MNGLNIVQQIPTYYGKQMEGVASVLAMAVQTLGVTKIPYVNCITTRPFTRVCNIDIPALWITAYPGPWESLLVAIEIIGLRNACRIYGLPENFQENEIQEIIEEWLKEGPLIVGPLDPTVIWDRIEPRYFKGAAHFLFVIDYEPRDSVFIAHDPAGCPYLHLSPETLWKTLRSGQGPPGIVQISSAANLHSEGEIFQRILAAGIQHRELALKRPDHISKSLKTLAAHFKNKTLKTSEAGALIYAVSELSVSLQQLAAFLLNSPPDVRDSLAEKVAGITALLSDYCSSCGHLLQDVKNTDHCKVPVAMNQMAVYEELLDTLFISLKESVAK